MSIMSKLSKAVRSLTSNEANADVSPGAGDVPPPEGGAVPRPDRDPVVVDEREREE